MRKPKTEIHFDTEDLNKIEYLKSIYNIKTRSGLVKHLINIHYDSHRYIGQSSKLNPLYWESTSSIIEDITKAKEELKNLKPKPIRVIKQYQDWGIKFGDSPYMVYATESLEEWKNIMNNLKKW